MYILSQPSESLSAQVLEAQLKHPTRNDWGQTVLNDLKDIGIELKDVKKITKI